MSLITTAVCRVRQAVIRGGRRSARPARPSVEEGAGSVFSVAQVLRSNRLRRPMVAAAGIEEAGVERVLHTLEENDIPYGLWRELPENPTAEDGEALRLEWVREQCDCFIAVGDGAVIDIAKAAAARAACRGRTLLDLVGRDRVHHKIPPVVAIPTVAGDASATMARAVFSDGHGGSFVMEDSDLVPAFVILDPELTGDTPRDRQAAAIVSGLSCAVESYLSGYGDDLSRASAADALRGYLEAAEPCWNSGGTPYQRSVLLTAARDAGEAAARAGVGYADALSRAVARVTGVGYGAACAAILPAVLEKYGNSVRDRLAALAELSGAAEDLPRGEMVSALIRRIRQLIFRIGLPDTLEVMSRDTITEIGDLAAAEANPYCACPAVWTAGDMSAVLRKASAVRE